MVKRWQRRKDARPPEILDAALAVFAQKGFAATKLDDIAAKAGITKGTIYLYFDSKQALFEALARQSVGAARQFSRYQRRVAALCAVHHGRLRHDQRPGGAAEAGAGGGRQFSRAG